MRAPNQVYLVVIYRYCLTTTRPEGRPRGADDDGAIDDGAGAGPLSRGAGDDLRRARGAAVRRRVGDLRPRQRRRRRRGALPAPGCAADVSRAQRAGDGACGDRVREGAFSPADDGVHDVDRTRRHQPDHGGGHRARESAAGAVPARRHLRLARARPGAAAGRGLPRRRDLRQRLLQARVALFRPHRRAVAAPDRVAPRDFDTDRSRAVRSRDARAAAGRAGRGVRLSGGVLRADASAHPRAGARKSPSSMSRRDCCARRSIR